MESVYRTHTYEGASSIYEAMLKSENEQGRMDEFVQSMRLLSIINSHQDPQTQIFQTKGLDIHQMQEMLDLNAQMSQLGGFSQLTIDHPIVCESSSRLYSVFTNDDINETFIERPFGWHKDIGEIPNGVELFPRTSKPTISFTASKISKFLGYIPFLGTAIGLHRIWQGVQEYRHFNNVVSLPNLRERSIKWVVRGMIECLPILGGLACAIADFAATFCKPNQILLAKSKIVLT